MNIIPISTATLAKTGTIIKKFLTESNGIKKICKTVELGEKNKLRIDTGIRGYKTSKELKGSPNITFTMPDGNFLHINQIKDPATIKEAKNVFKELKNDAFVRSATHETAEKANSKISKLLIQGDINVSGKEKVLVQAGGNKKIIPDLQAQIKKGDVTVLHDQINNTTTIAIPYGESSQNYYAVQLDEIYSETKAKEFVKYLNINGSYKLSEKEIKAHAINFFNNNKTAQYTKDNIGIRYNFNNGESSSPGGMFDKMKESAGIYDTRNYYKGYFSWDKNCGMKIVEAQDIKTNKALTGIIVPLHGNPGRGQNCYSIWLHGMYSKAQAENLINHLNKTVIQDAGNVKREELIKIQNETLNYLNSL